MARFVRTNEGEYAEVLRRFRRDVDIRKIKDRKDFQKKVTAWANLSKKPRSGARLAQAFEDILVVPVRERKVRRVAVAEIIPKKMKRRVTWNQPEVDVIREERREGRGYAKRAAIRLGRTPKSIYMKTYRLKKKRR